jgi:hypothetical protein
VPGPRTRPVAVKFAANFETNLASIEAFVTEGEFAQGYDRLLEELSDVVVPNLERFPAMGRPFLTRAARSIEALNIADRLRAKLAEFEPGAELREYVMQDYVILYALLGNTVYMLSIKHQRQVSFDLSRFWFDDDQSA